MEYSAGGQMDEFGRGILSYVICIRGFV